MSHESHAETFLGCLLRADRAEALQILMTALAGGSSASELLLGVVQPALNEIGERWSRQRASLSQVYVAGRIADDATDALAPLIPATTNTTGKVVIGTILGDYHGLGRKIVAAFLRAGGFAVVDLGLSVAAETYVEAADRESADLIAVSALMVHTTGQIARIRPLLDERGKSQVRVLVGGAPFNFDAKLYLAVGADATARHAGEALVVARRFLEGGQKPR